MENVLNACHIELCGSFEILTEPGSFVILSLGTTQIFTLRFQAEPAE